MSDVIDVIAATNPVVDLNRFAQARADLAATIATAATLTATAQVIPIPSPLDAALAENARLRVVNAINAQNIDRVVDDLMSNHPHSASWQCQVLLGERDIPLVPWRAV